MILNNENINVKNISVFYKNLGDEIDKNDEVIIDFVNVKRIDLSAGQVIIAAAREAKRLGKNIKLKSVSEGVKTQMRICGLKL